jgi:hypothetical protein
LGFLAAGEGGGGGGGNEESRRFATGAGAGAGALIGLLVFAAFALHVEHPFLENLHLEQP